MKFILMGLIKSFTKEMGRSPNVGELNLLRREAELIERQDKIIPFPQGGKDKISPFTPRPKEGEISVTIEGKTQNMTPEGIMDTLMKGGKETDAEIIARMNRQNKESVERLKKKKEKDLGEKLKDYDGDPDAMAMGGRAGYAVGGLSKLLKMLQGKVGKKNITTADKIARPESALNREMFGEFNERVSRKILDVPPMPSGFKLSREKLLKNFPELDESYADEILALDKELQGTVLTMLKDRRKDPKAYDKLLMEKGDTLDFQGEFDRSVKRSKNANGGVAGTELAIKESLEAFKRYQKAGGKLSYKDFIASGNEGVGRFFKDGGRIKLAGGGAIAKLIKMLSAKSPVGRYKDYLASVKKRSIEGDFKSLAPELGAISAGGILVNRKMKSILEEGNELQKERFLKEYIEELNNDPSYKDRPELKDKLIENYTKSLFGQKKAGGGLAYMLGESRDGLKEGGPPNPGRRNFMKLMAGLASIPVLGKFFKPAAKVAKTVVPLTNTTTTMPAWFPKFVDKVIDKGVGTKIDADIMKYEVKELPGIQVTKHDDGRIYVEGQNDYSRSYDIEYQPPGYEVVDYKTGKAVKTKGDFTASEEVPVNMDPDGNTDFEGEILEEVGDILGGDARTMQEFATGKKLKTSTRGESRVGQAEVRMENEADAYAERMAEEADDFATGGLAKLLGE